MDMLTLIGVGLVARLREWFASESHHRRVQDKKLRALLRHARENVPLYQRMLRNIDVDKCALEEIPPISKRMLMENLEDSLAVRGVSRAEIEDFARGKENAGKLFKGKYILCTTSGTTGFVGYFMYDKKAWSAMRAVEFVRMLRHRLGPWHIARFSFGRRLRWAMVIAMGGHYVTHLLATIVPKASVLLANVRQISIMSPMKQIVDQLNGFKPHLMHGYPTFLEALAHEQLAGRLDIDPEFISSGSEPFTRGARQRISQAWKRAVLSETYGTTEFVALANQCKHGSLHANIDYCIIEAVDDLYNPVRPGQRGSRILLTNLLNYTQPIIRYEITDSVVYTGETCPCGSKLPVIQVHGRTDDTFFLKEADGVFRAHPPIPFEVLFLRVDGLRQFQLVHEEQNWLRVRFACADDIRPEVVRERIHHEFQQYFAQHNLEGQIKLTFEEINQVTRNPTSQKMRQIYSKVSPPPANASRADGA
ncbi:MAG: hypothetical protein GMKNLPBB_00077 [Myxococcota bacterium]|nr:hypothetical protein [Myxococcota bacterium]